MSTPVQRGDRLFGPGGLGHKHSILFPGATPNISATQVADRINRALDQVEAGHIELADEPA